MGVENVQFVKFTVELLHLLLGFFKLFLLQVNLTLKFILLDLGLSIQYLLLFSQVINYFLCLMQFLLLFFNVFL